MFFKCHVKSFGHAVCVAALSAFVCLPSFSKTKTAQQEPTNFDELEQAEPAPEKAEEKQEAPISPAPEAPPVETKPATPKRSPLPTVDELVESKLSALRKKQDEQAQALAIAEQKLEQEIANEERVFDNNAYLSLSIKNSAPPREYELRKTEVYVDGKLVLRGGKRNQGLPRTLEIFSALAPGCHDIEVRAQYIRLKNDLISRFKVNRIEDIRKNLSFEAKNGYRVQVNIEGFEQQNSLINWSRGPAIRFNRQIKHNFYEGAPIVSVNDVLKQGQVHIEYVTEETTHHRLIEKSLSIDGLPILVKEKHDPEKDSSVVFDAPLGEGKHTLNVVLLFGEQKWVKGGPLYNFRLTFNRDFYVVSGQTTAINLTGMPHDGFRRSPMDSRYARVTSSISSKESAQMFSDMTCKEQREKQAVVDRAKIRDDAKLKKKEEEEAKRAKKAAPQTQTPPAKIPSRSTEPEQTPAPASATTEPPAPTTEPAEPKEPEELPLLPQPLESPADEPLPPIIVPGRQPLSLDFSPAALAPIGG